MRISKCPSCGGKIDRTFSSCPICGDAFKCFRCGIVLENNESTMCSECSSIVAMKNAEALRDVGNELKNMGDELRNISSKL